MDGACGLGVVVGEGCAPWVCALCGMRVCVMYVLLESMWSCVLVCMCSCAFKGPDPLRS